MFKKNYFIYFIFITLATSCSTNRYVFENSNSQIGVDFTKGKWLLNELDTDKDNIDKLTSITSDFFEEKVGNRFSYVKNQKNLLIAQKSYFNCSKSAMQDLKKGTGFDYFINIVSKKNKSEMSGLQLYQKEIPGTNESEVFIEIIDLNKQEVVFKEHVIGKYQKNKKESIWDYPNKPKSTKLLDNIDINKTSNKLLVGSLNKILEKLDKTSAK